MGDKAKTQPVVLDRKGFLKLERQMMIAWSIMGIFAFMLLISLFLIGRGESNLAGVINFQDLARTHSVSVSYKAADLPPAGGNHQPSWQTCGIYVQSLDPSFAIHSLEHGAVWLTYRPDLSADQVTQLQDFVRGQEKVLMSPYPELKNDVVMTAWGKQLVINTVPNEQIEAFIERYREQGPEADADCNGGVGTPLH